MLEFKNPNHYIIHTDQFLHSVFFQPRSIHLLNMGGKKLPIGLVKEFISSATSLEPQHHLWIKAERKITAIGDL